eukprot:9648003-Prorocentrum_lima.AAC.1
MLLGVAAVHTANKQVTTRQQTGVAHAVMGPQGGTFPLPGHLPTSIAHSPASGAGQCLWQPLRAPPSIV